jgi:hypothetical protein
MTREDIYDAITAYLEIIEDSHSVEEGEETLKLALDRLALAYHYAECNFDIVGYPDAPPKDYNKLREVVSPKFPNCGFYNAAHKVSVEIGLESILVADAIDDICDIAIDMDEVIWLWKNSTVDIALWRFTCGYREHWGAHLRNLQVYLLAKQRNL